MKLVWSPETASKAYLETVKSCRIFNDSGVAEFLSAMAAGWNTKLIVESWSYGGPVATSIGLAVAARRTSGRHVCIVQDERSKSSYVEAMAVAGVPSTVIVGDAEEAMEGLSGIDFLVVDSKRKDFARVLRYAKLSHKGAILACKNACRRAISGFRWNRVLGKETRVVRSVVLPVGQGLDIAHIGADGGVVGYKNSSSRWIKHIDQRSGEEHFFRG
ncbi:hypothetical protein J1N35_025952 [Gossypium stocksii]|uniref:Ankyrin repeat/KH domain protein n=1 Tax=Gossypium stocksii TaxID=47602 RepID=A0A9D3ZYB7_9ROSI|nr:hypothetical protein J1N35_025952 [Gossypium stocksii]